MADAFPWIRSPHGEVTPHGAHVVRWKKDGRDVLFVSPRSKFEPGQAIRGGIPICFPWFGDDPEQKGRPAHGFARRVPWRLVEERHAPEALRVAFELADDDASRAHWPFRFRARLTASLGSTLDVALTVRNEDERPFRFEEALHTYLAVGDVRRVTLRGLEGARYRDKVRAGAIAHEPAAPLTLTGETDRTYHGIETACTLEDPVLGRKIELVKCDSRSTIVWNPWPDKAARLADLGADAWQGFVCIESGNIGPDAITLAPGASHTLALCITVRPYS
jgi:D-hexose-6-phosphate mutarotase